VPACTVPLWAHVQMSQGLQLVRFDDDVYVPLPHAPQTRSLVFVPAVET